MNPPNAVVGCSRRFELSIYARESPIVIFVKRQRNRDRDLRMRDEIRFKLDAAIEAHETSKRAAATAKQFAENSEQIFLAQFSEARDSIIRPAMEEIGNYIKGKGYDYEVTEEDDKPSLDHRSRSTPASITFTIFVGKRHYPLNENPMLSVICEKGLERVRFHESTISRSRGGHSGSAGAVTLNELTEELIHEKILKVVAEVFR